MRACSPRVAGVRRKGSEAGGKEHVVLIFIP